MRIELLEGVFSPLQYDYITQLFKGFPFFSQQYIIYRGDDMENLKDLPTAKLARVLGITPKAVNEWKKKGIVEKKVAEIIKLAELARQTEAYKKLEKKEGK